MRQLSVPLRWAAVTALTIAASTGCMSVGEDDAGAPGPSRSTGAKGSDVDPAGDTVTDSGRAGGRPGGRPPAIGPGRPRGHPAPGRFRRRALGDAEGPAPRTGRAEAHPGHRRYAARADALGPGAGRAAADRSGAATTTPPAPDPDPEPDPEPTVPPEPQPSATPGAQLRAQGMNSREAVRPLRTPEASPQVKPV